MTITSHRLNAVMWLAAAGLVVLGMAIFATAWALPMEDPGPRVTSVDSVDVRGGGKGEALPSLAELQRVAQVTLYRPTEESAGPAPPAETQPAVEASPPPPSLEAQLIGTVTEGPDSWAFFELADGQTVMRRVGQSIAGANVVAIEERLAVLELQGRTMTLQTPRRAGEDGP